MSITKGPNHQQWIFTQVEKQKPHYAQQLRPEIDSINVLVSTIENMPNENQLCYHCSPYFASTTSWFGRTFCSPSNVFSFVMFIASLSRSRSLSISLSFPSVFLGIFSTSLGVFLFFLYLFLCPLFVCWHFHHPSNHIILPCTRFSCLSCSANVMTG